MKTITVTGRKHLVKNTIVIGLLLVLSALSVSAQQRTVTGIIQNSSDAPVDKVSVVIKGTRRGTTTNAQGRFSIQASANETLVISSVGFETQEIKTGNQTSFTITLRESSGQMEGVVITSLGITRQERSLGYSATTVTNEQLTDAISSNWSDALSGKVAGLNLVRSNSGPTGSNKIILRGENNLTGENEALIVVDGVVINQGSGRRSSVSGETVYGTGSDNMPADYGSSVNDINPEDVESVTVLKGPGAAALYGQRGANGAIIITTKSGSAKRKGLGVTFNSNASIEKINRWPDLQYDYGQGLDGSAYYSFGAGPDGPSTSATSSAYGPRFNGQMFYQYDPITGKQGTVRTPWVAYPDKSREYFKSGNTITNSISIDGGTDKTTARLSLTNVNNNWITPNTGYKRNTVSLSVNSKVSDKLQISSKINYTNKWSDNLPGAGYGNQSIMYWYIFWQPNADLDWLKQYWVPGQEGRRIFYPFSSFPENPYAIAYEFINKSNRHNITGNVQANYNFTKGLSLQVRTSLDLSYEERAQQRPYDAGSKYQKGSYRTQDIFSQEVSSDFLLRYNTQIKKDLDLTFSVGGSVLRNNYNRDETRADSLNNPGIYSFANNAGPLISMPWKSKYGINSLYGLISAGYRKYLYLDLTGRKDWNSVLATPSRSENSGFFYPSASLSFVLSDVTKLPAAFDFVKLRFSTSGVGSGGTTPYLTAYNYQTAGSLYNGGLQNPSLLANPNLRPLKTITNELGANIRMFKNRLGFDIAAYIGNTKDQILQRVVDRSSGFTRALINAGRVSNQGLELAINGTPLVSKSFKWTSSFVFSTNRNRIEELADSSVVLQTGPVGGGQIVASVGGSMGDLYGRGYVRSPEGQVVYDPVTGFAQISQDVVYLGNTIPKYKMGFTNQFSYNQFRLNFLFDAQVGGVAHSLMHYKMAEQGKTTNTLPGRYNGIIGNGVVLGTDGKYRPNTTIATDIDEYYRSHYGIDNAEGSTFSTDFIKFREARLDFTIGQKLTKKLGLQKATFGIYGRDLFIWSPWPMFDPEFGTLSGTDVVRGFETGQFPSTRTFGANLIIGL
jgi:TonB-linked SusC/RagA family outer membrane protein